MGLYLNIGPWKWWNEILRVGPNPIWLVSYKKRRLGHSMHRGMVCSYREKRSICKPRKEVSEETILLTSWSWSSGFQNCVELNFYFLSHRVCGTCHGSSTKWIQDLKGLLWERMGQFSTTDILWSLERYTISFLWGVDSLRRELSKISQQCHDLYMICHSPYSENAWAKIRKMDMY